MADANPIKLCECGCGAEVGRRFVSGHNSKLPRKHGMSSTRMYMAWAGMIARCKRPSHSHWKFYGARGITVCDRWLKFENFLADMGERPAGTSLDRYPNRDGNYEAGNCRWATALEQRANRDDNIRVGEESLKDLAKKHGLKYSTLYHRYITGERGSRLTWPTRLTSKDTAD